MTVRYARRAVADLAEIGDFIAGRSRKSADAVVNRIRASISLLETLPRMGRPTDDADIRMFPVVRHPYLVYYEVLTK
jgi:toxin ParE1/3/4